MGLLYSVFEKIEQVEQKELIDFQVEQLKIYLPKRIIDQEIQISFSKSFMGKNNVNVDPFANLPSLKVMLHSIKKK